MKTFFIIKIGYSSRAAELVCGYGCTGEHFICVISEENGRHHIFNFSGLLGSQNRVAKHLREKGFEEVYVNSNSFDFLSEEEAIERIKNI